MSEGHTTPVIKEEGEFRTPLFRTPEQERDRKGRFTKSVLDMNEARQSTLDAVDQCVDVDASDDEQAEAAALKSGISKTWEKKVRLETLKNEEATREFEQQQVALENENNEKMAMQSANSSYVQSTLFEAIALCKDGYLMELSSDDRLFLMGKAHDVFDANDLVVALLKHHGSNTAVKVDIPDSHSSDEFVHGHTVVTEPIVHILPHGGRSSDESVNSLLAIVDLRDQMNPREPDVTLRDPVVDLRDQMDPCEPDINLLDPIVDLRNQMDPCEPDIDPHDPVVDLRNDMDLRDPYIDPHDPDIDPQDPDKVLHMQNATSNYLRLFGTSNLSRCQYLYLVACAKAGESIENSA